MFFHPTIYVGHNQSQVVDQILLSPDYINLSSCLSLYQLHFLPICLCLYKSPSQAVSLSYGGVHDSKVPRCLSTDIVLRSVAVLPFTYNSHTS